MMSFEAFIEAEVVREWKELREWNSTIQERLNWYMAKRDRTYLTKRIQRTTKLAMMQVAMMMTAKAVPLDIKTNWRIGVLSDKGGWVSGGISTVSLLKEGAAGRER